MQKRFSNKILKAGAYTTFFTYSLPELMASYHFNPKLRQLTHSGVTQTLSPKENELLKMLAEHLNDLLPRDQALKKIWGSDTYFNGRSMDVYIAKLRKYLKEDPKIEIVNIHGNGFRLVVQP